MATLGIVFVVRNVECSIPGITFHHVTVGTVTVPVKGVDFGRTFVVRGVAVGSDFALAVAHAVRWAAQVGA